jgi:hypothetical protein
MRDNNALHLTAGLAFARPSAVNASAIRTGDEVPGHSLWLLVFLFGIFGHAASAGTLSADTTIVERLGAMAGAFEYSTEDGRFVYRGADFWHELERYHDDDAAIRQLVPLLVECMGNNCPSASTLRDAAVLRGMMCYWFLIHLVYPEPEGASGSIDLNWPGFILPDASREQLQRAKAAWLKVVAEGRYTPL